MGGGTRQETGCVHSAAGAGNRPTAEPFLAWDAGADCPPSNGTRGLMESLIGWASARTHSATPVYSRCMKIRVIPIACLWVASQVGNAQGVFLPATDARLRADVSLLVDEGVFNLPVNEWPLAREDVAQAVSS